MNTNVRKYADREILDRVSSLPSFKGFPTGFWDVWIRSNEDEYNKFDDKVYTFKGEVFQMVCTGTTNAGAEGLKNYAKYNSKGCAVLKSDVIVYDSHIIGKHKGEYDAYIQGFTNGFPYFRDGDKDNKAEEIGKEYNDRIGANCHAAGEASELIGGWSVACLVRNVKKQYLAWMKLLNRQTKLTVCILKEF